MQQDHVLALLRTKSSLSMCTVCLMWPDAILRTRDACKIPEIRSARWAARVVLRD